MRQNNLFKEGGEIYILGMLGKGGGGGWGGGGGRFCRSLCIRLFTYKDLTGPKSNQSGGR